MKVYAERLKAAGEETRLRILAALARAGVELCACELIDVLGKPQSAMSRHLGVLVQAGLISERREGRNMFYALRPEDPFNRALYGALALAQAAGADKPSDACPDHERLESRLAERRNGCCVRE